MIIVIEALIEHCGCTAIGSELKLLKSMEALGDQGLSSCPDMKRHGLVIFIDPCPCLLAIIRFGIGWPSGDGV